MLDRFQDNPNLLFNEFFVNCYINPMISFINLYDQSYRKAAFMNGYSYLLKPFQYRMVPFRYVQHTEEFVENFKNAVTVEYRNYKNPKDFISEIREELSLGSHIIMFVDLYYWAPQIGLPQDIHFGHAMPILSYQSDIDGFHLYDIDKNLNYRHYQVTSRCIVEAYNQTCEYVCSSETTELIPKEEIKLYDYAVIRPKDKLESYKISKEQLVANTKRLIKELTALQLVRSNHDAISQIVIENPSLGTLSCTNLSQMQKGNKMLFQELNRLGMIDDGHLCQLEEKAQQLSHQTMSILGKIVKNNLLNNWTDVADILRQVEDQNKEEILLWKRLYEALQ